MSKKKLLGNWGENVAEKYLVSKGYNIICKNYYTRFGEIDIIAVSEQILCFIEVKTRTSYYLGATKSVNYKKRQRIMFAAKHFCKKSSQFSKSIRFEFVGVYLNVQLKKCYVQHIFIE